MEQPDKRHGDNLYPVTLTERFGEHVVELDVPEGVWNPTPHGIHLGNMLGRLDFSSKHALEIGTGCGIHAILLARQGAHLNRFEQLRLRKVGPLLTWQEVV